ncbi:unnamed protein product [Pleuronectes platessa]|uniref:Uncharacterized protein n=1 Tax=Pleuronectes platessa TaxID=8262 RepID=A0A9N7VP16_PLEPL|nr:unnamed protein product [Pleuronectes platessa]
MHVCRLMWGHLHDDGSWIEGVLAAKVVDQGQGKSDCSHPDRKSKRSTPQGGESDLNPHTAAATAGRLSWWRREEEEEEEEEEEGAERWSDGWMDGWVDGVRGGRAVPTRTPV